MASEKDRMDEGLLGAIKRELTHVRNVGFRCGYSAGYADGAIGNVDDVDRALALTRALSAIAAQETEGGEGDQP